MHERSDVSSHWLSDEIHMSGALDVCVGDMGFSEDAQRKKERETELAQTNRTPGTSAAHCDQRTRTRAAFG